MNLKLMNKEYYYNSYEREKENIDNNYGQDLSKK